MAYYYYAMKILLWDVPKNEKFKRERGITFEEVANAIAAGGVLDVVGHPATRKYPGQRIYVVEIRDYVYLVPYVETEEHQFLKTIIPSRKARKKYLGKEQSHEGEA